MGVGFDVWVVVGEKSCVGCVNVFVFWCDILIFLVGFYDNLLELMN